MKRDAKLNCRQVNPMLYLKRDEMNDAEMSVLYTHLHACDKCSRIRDTVEKTIHLLRPPDDLTWHEEKELIDIKTIMGSETKSKRQTKPTLKVLAGRISNVAAVLLIMLFIAEQSFSVQKILRLEKRFTQISHDEKTRTIDRITLYQSKALNNRFPVVSGTRFHWNSADSAHISEAYLRSVPRPFLALIQSKINPQKNMNHEKN